MWQLWGMAKTTRSRPSELMGIEDDPYLAYCLDQAVAHVGQTLEADIETVTHKNPKIQARRREARLIHLLGLRQVDMPGRFKSPGS